MSPFRGSTCGFDTEYCSIRIGSARSFFGSDVDISILALLDIADANRELRQQRLAPLGLRRLIERDALKLLTVQRSHEEVVLPGREFVAGVENDARWTDRRYPE